MVFQHALGGLPILHLPEGVFIDDISIPRVLEDARRYPRLGLVEEMFLMQVLDVKSERTSSTNQPPLKVWGDHKCTETPGNGLRTSSHRGSYLARIQTVFCSVEV
jgi:hypothetical protein